MAGHELVTKSLKEKCVSAEVILMVGNMDNLQGIWKMLDMHVLQVP